MAQCLTVQTITTAAGDVQVVVPGVEPCTSYIALTPGEFAQITANPFVLSVEDGALISGAIGGVWCLAWAVRAVRSALHSDGESSTT